MALAQPTDDMLFKPMSMELLFLGIDKFPKDALRESVAHGKDEIQFTGVRQASEYGTRQHMNYTVFMRRYEKPNFYQPYAIDAMIEGIPERGRRFDLTDVPLRIENIQNLLNGRHVEKKRFDRFLRNVDTYWYRLDFSKWDDKGYMLQETSAAQLAMRKGATKWDGVSTAVDLIAKLPLLENTLPGLRLNLAREVAQGDAAGVSVKTKSGSIKGFIQFGDRPDKIDLLIYQGSKLVKVGPDLQGRGAEGEGMREKQGRKAKSI